MVVDFVPSLIGNKVGKGAPERKLSRERSADPSSCLSSSKRKNRSVVVEAATVLAKSGEGKRDHKRLEREAQVKTKLRTVGTVSQTPRT